LAVFHQLLTRAAAAAATASGRYCGNSSARDQRRLIAAVGWPCPRGVIVVGSDCPRARPGSSRYCRRWNCPAVVETTRPLGSTPTPGRRSLDRIVDIYRRSFTAAAAG